MIIRLTHENREFDAEVGGGREGGGGVVVGGEVRSEVVSYSQVGPYELIGAIFIFKMKKVSTRVNCD